MKKRIAKKQLKKMVGYMTVCGSPVYNFVTNPEYDGGSCIERDEDCYKCEITYTRKRRGAPLLLNKRWGKLYEEIYCK